MEDKKPPELKVKKVKGRINFLKAMPYRGCIIYVRQVDEQIFMFDFPFENQIYGDYFIFEPQKGKEHLTKKEVIVCAGWTFAAGSSMVDELILKREKELLSNSVADTTIKKRASN